MALCSGAVTPARAEGHQRTFALHAADNLTLGRVSVNAGIRYDAWRNYDAACNNAPLADRSDSSWSPRVTALVEATPALSFAGHRSAYRDHFPNPRHGCLDSNLALSLVECQKLTT